MARETSYNGLEGTKISNQQKLAVDSQRGAIMSIDWSTVNWGYVALLSGFTFIAALVANYITFRHRVAAAVLAALLFAVVFVLVTYYPHGIPFPALK